jgi:acetylornithine deacetylase/succinyl-diaminopimelate desuccinylase-like protein
MPRIIVGGLVCALLASSGVAKVAAPPVSASHAKVISAIEAKPAFKAAVAELDREHDQWVANIVTLTEIESPPFKEKTRAAAYAEMFRKLGLTDVEIDPEGNVLGLRKGTGKGGKIVVSSAHMDTVFPAGTPVKIRREGDKLFAPGVGDDSTGLATQISLINALNAGKIATPSDILFVGSVGEEGLGDLRGVRYLFNKGKYKDRIGAFFSIDGTSASEFTVGGVGSKRYRLTFKGPGGHSFGAFGLVNPMVALGQVVTDLYKIPVPASPKTTYSASVIGGGTSVNAIPREVWLEVDMRSESAVELAKEETAFLAIVKKAVADENGARSTKEGAISVDAKLVGDRPAGSTALDADIVRYATAAYVAEGITPDLGAGSTDSNVAMSLGIPAITIPRAAEGGRGHSIDEWIGTAKAGAVKIRKLDLAILLATAGYR